MLPIGDGTFLEIVTVFHGQREVWKHQTKEDQLQNFMIDLKKQGLLHVWGSSNSPEKKTKKVIPNPRKR
jgi:hypothetical protein